MFDIASNLKAPGPLPDPAEIYQRGLQLRGLGQQNAARAEHNRQAPIVFQQQQDAAAQAFALGNQQQTINANTIANFPTQNARAQGQLNSDKTEREAKVIDLLHGLTATAAYMAQSDPENAEMYAEGLKKQIAAVGANNPDLSPDHFDTTNMDSAHFKDPVFLKRASRLLMSPEDRSKLELTERAKEAWATLKPKLDAAVGELAAKGAMKQADYNRSILPLVTQIPAEVMALPEVKEYLGQVDKAKMQPQPSFAMLSMQPVKPSIIENAAQRIARGESTVSEEINKGRFSGQMAMQVHDDLLNRVQALKPGFSEAESEAGFSFSKNPATKRAVQQLDNAYTTIGRLRDIYAKLDNTQYPTLNKAINAGKVQVGDVDAARAMIGEVLGNDELTQAFARGGMGSDKLRDMSAALANKNLSPQQMAAQFDEILQGVDRSREAYENGSYGYIKPPKYRKESAKNADYAETRTYQGKTYGLKPGSDRKNKDNWVMIP